jgi:diaminopropionate ammonia-lyase
MASLTPPDVLLNPAAQARIPAAARTREALAVHRWLPGYAPTPLASCPDLAASVGVGQLWVKDESARLGLPAFKMLGASYACYRELTRRLGRNVPWQTISELAAGLGPLGDLTLCAATDGNHGRAVARMARLLGLHARIYVPDGIARPRIDAIAVEGADVVVLPGGYDDAIGESARQASDTCVIISDTSWPGYEQIPAWVIAGYSTIFAECSDQLRAAGQDDPDVVVIPVGVGALAAATVSHFKAPGAGPDVAIVGVEPVSARCVTESLRAGHPVTLPFPQTSIMAGLNCGTPSLLAWPLLQRGLDATAVVADDWAKAAMRSLAAAGIAAGETGAAALAGLQAICTHPAGDDARPALRLGPASRVLVLCTEGVTDAASWTAITGQPAPEAAWPGPTAGGNA